jgi:large repetitive protein
MKLIFNKYFLILQLVLLTVSWAEAQEAYASLTISNKSFPDASDGGTLIGSNVKIDGMSVYIKEKLFCYFTRNQLTSSDNIVKTLNIGISDPTLTVKLIVYYIHHEWNLGGTIHYQNLSREFQVSNLNINTQGVSETRTFNSFNGLDETISVNWSFDYQVEITPFKPVVNEIKGKICYNVPFLVGMESGFPGFYDNSGSVYDWEYGLVTNDLVNNQAFQTYLQNIITDLYLPAQVIEGIDFNNISSAIFSCSYNFMTDYLYLYDNLPANRGVISWMLLNGLRNQMGYSLSETEINFLNNYFETAIVNQLDCIVPFIHDISVKNWISLASGKDSTDLIEFNPAIRLSVLTDKAKLSLRARAINTSASKTGPWSDAPWLDILPSPPVAGSIKVDSSCINRTTGAIKISGIASPVNTSLFAYRIINGNLACSAFVDNPIDIDGYSVTKEAASGSYKVCLSYSSEAIKGCVSEQPITVPSLPELNYQVFTKDVSCPGGSDGSIRIEILERAGDFISMVDELNVNNKSVHEFTGLPAKTYEVKVSDFCYNLGQDFKTIKQPEFVKINKITPLIPTCISSPNGGFGVEAVGITKDIYDYYIYKASDYPSGSPLITATEKGPNWFNYTLPGGTYIINVRDHDHPECSGAVSDVMVLDAVIPLDLSIDNVFKVKCFGGNTGEIDVSAGGGSGSYRFNIEGDIHLADTAKFILLRALFYTVSVRNRDESCADVSSKLITVGTNPILEINLTPKDAKCFENNDGQINTVVTGGSGSYQSYSWEQKLYGSWFPHSATVASPNNLMAGEYRIKVTDSEACFGYASDVVHQPDILSITNVLPHDVICYGTKGSIDITAEGGNRGYSFFYSANGGASYTGFTSGSQFVEGNYFLKVRDSKGCEARWEEDWDEKEVKVTGPSSALDFGTTLSDYNGYNISGYGKSDGALTITPAGGNGEKGGGGNYSGYTYSFSGRNDQPNSVFSNIGVGTYNVKVTDGRGCQISKSVSLTQPDILDLTAASIEHVICFGSATGKITVSATGGAGPYIYQKNGSGFVSTPVFNGLIAGAYQIKVKDSNGNLKDLQVTVENKNEKIGSILIPLDVQCYGESNGQIAATLTGGSGSYNYVWQKLVSGNWQTRASGTSNLYNLDPGKYRLITTDSDNCSAFDSTVISQPALLTISGVVPHDIVCFGNTGRIDITSAGGKGGYQYSYSVNDGASYTQFIPGSPMSAASYKLKVTDLNSCETKWNSEVKITGPAEALNFTTSLSDYNGLNISCYGRSDGSITINPIGGNGSGYNGYTYSFDGGPASQTSVLPNLIAGTYSIKVTDSRSCSVTKPVTLTQPPFPVGISVSIHTDTKCFNDSSGLITISASGGAQPYQYMIGQGSYVASNEFTNLPGGSYLFTVKDKNGCTNTLSSAIANIYPKPAITLLSEDIKCYQKNDGSIQSSISGGSGNFGLKWYIRSGNNWQYIKSDSTKITSLAPGEYRIQATDLAGCPAIYESTAVNENVTPLVISQVTLKDIVCYSESGSIEIQASGSNGGYIYQYSQNNQSFVNYSPGTSLPSADYKVRVLDSKGCLTEWSEKLSITKPATALDFSWFAKDFNGSNVSCFGKSDGIISVKPIGGNGIGYQGYSYLLWGGTVQTDSVFSDLSAGTYNLSVTDGRGCKISRSVSLLQPPGPLALTVSKLLDTKCFNDSSGVIALEASGGINPYEYKIGQKNYVPTNEFGKLPTGNYDFAVRDKNGCTNEINSAITNIFPKPSITLLPKEINCYQKNDGLIQSSLTGGSGNFGVKWYMKTGSSWNYFRADSIRISNLSPGDYRIQVTDLAGCPAIYDSTTVIQRVKPLLIDNLKLKDIICFGDSGRVDIKASGGNGGYIYQYSQNNGSYSDYSPGASIPFSEYRFRVKDAKGCETLWQENLVITQPEKPLDIKWLTKDYAGYNVSCYGNNDGRMIVTPSGGNGSGYNGYSFLLSGRTLQRDTLFEELYAGDYILKVTDGRGCTLAKPITLTQPVSELGLWTTGIKMATCIEGSDGRVSLAASGGSLPYTYSSGDDVFVSGSEFRNLKVNTYRFTVKDANGCTQIFDTSIINIVPKMDIAGRISDANCFGQNSGTISVTISGGAKPFTYQWKDFPIAGPEVENLFKGNYKFTVIDSAGCLAGKEFEVKEPLKPLIINSVKLKDIVCYGDSGNIQIQASGSNGGYTYQYSKNSQSFENYTPTNPLPFGSYRMRVKDMKGCETEWSEYVTITQPPKALGLTWNAKDYNGSNVLCFGDSNGQLIVKPYGGNGEGYQGYSFFLSGRPVQTDTVFSDLKAGSYFVKITDGRGCSATFPVSLHQPSAPVGLMISKLTDTKCFNDSTGSVKLSGIGGVQPYQYLKSRESFVSGNEFNNLPTGNYHFMVRDGNSCLDSISTTINNTYPKPSITLVPQDIRCYQKNDGQVQLSLTGGSGCFGLNWYKKSANSWQYFRSDSSRITGLAPGDYRVQVTDLANCPSLYDSTSVYQKVTPLNVAATSLPACVQLPNGNILATASGGTPPYLFGVDQSKMQTSSSFPVYSGFHKIYAADTYNCIAETASQVGVRNTMPLVNFMVATSRYELDTLVIKDVSVPGPDRVSWGFSPEALVISSDNLETKVRYSMAGIYPVKMTGYFETCEYSLEKLITIAPFDPLVIPKDKFLKGIEKVQISPNPNNGQFRVKVKLYTKQQIQIKVLDYYSKIHYSERFPETIELEQDINIQGALPGTYILWVITDDDYKALLFIISQ